MEPTAILKHGRKDSSEINTSKKKQGKCLKLQDKGDKYGGEGQ